MAKDNSKYLCREHNTCKECIDRMKQEDPMSYIYIGVREQRAGELIDQLATADHSLRSTKVYVKDVTLLTIMHIFLIIQVLKKVVLQVVTYMLLEVKAKVKTRTTTIATTIEQNAQTVVTSTKKMHVGPKIKNVIFAIN